MTVKKNKNDENKNIRVEKIILCKTELIPIVDAIYIITGKWKIPITIALMEGNKRFGEIIKEIPKITSKVLAHELKVMAQNGFVEKKGYNEAPVRIEYELTEYSWSVKPVILSLRDFGIIHREKLRKERNREE